MNKNLGKISFLGNCQTLAYSKYIADLLPDQDIKWLCPDRFAIRGDKWMTMEDLWGDGVNEHVICQDEVYDNLIKSDILIYTPMNSVLSKGHNTEAINEKHKENTKIITVSTIHTNVEGMKERECRKNIDIRFSEIFDKYPNSAGVADDKNGMHPNTFTILESVRMICDFLNIKYFSDEDYKRHLNSGYPFEQNK